MTTGPQRRPSWWKAPPMASLRRASLPDDLSTPFPAPPPFLSRDFLWGPQALLANLGTPAPSPECIWALFTWQPPQVPLPWLRQTNPPAFPRASRRRVVFVLQPRMSVPPPHPQNCLLESPSLKSSSFPQNLTLWGTEGGGDKIGSRNPDHTQGARTHPPNQLTWRPSFL